MIVADTNLVAYLLLPGDQTAAARAAFARDPAWAAPLLWRSEFRNLLALYLRQGYLTLPKAIEIQRAAEELFAGREYAVSSEQVLPLAAKSGRSAYDCEFVAVALALSVPLVTSDAQILASFPEVALDLRAFGSAGA